MRKTRSFLSCSHNKFIHNSSGWFCDYHLLHSIYNYFLYYNWRMVWVFSANLMPPSPVIHTNCEIWAWVQKQAGKWLFLFCDIFTWFIQQNVKMKRHLTIFCTDWIPKIIVESNLGEGDRQVIGEGKNRGLAIESVFDHKKYMGINNSAQYQWNHFEFMWRSGGIIKGHMWVTSKSIVYGFVDVMKGNDVLV